MSQLLDNVCSELQRLPGVGRRTALRLAMHILRMDEEDVVSMGESLIDFRTKICRCAKCNNLSDTEICDICADSTRDRSTVCVVEQVSDLLSIEKTHQYRGVYSVLGGVISPMDGIGPSNLKIAELVKRVEDGGVKEIIFAIHTISSEQKSEIIDICTGGDLANRVLFITAKEKGVIKKRNGMYIYGEDGDLILGASEEAVISKNTSSSAPALSYASAIATGSPASCKLTKFTPFTTLPACTSRHGIILFVCILFHLPI